MESINGKGFELADKKAIQLEPLLPTLLFINILFISILVCFFSVLIRSPDGLSFQSQIPFDHSNQDPSLQHPVSINGVGMSPVSKKFLPNSLLFHPRRF